MRLTELFFQHENSFWIIISLLMTASPLIILVFYNVQEDKNGIITGILISTTGIIVAMLSGWKKKPTDYNP